MEPLNSSLVLVGQGFTPQLVGKETFGQVFPEEPTNLITTPVITQLDYPGHVLTILPDRAEIKRLYPHDGADERMTAFAGEVLRLWPLARITAFGLNFSMSEVYEGEGGQSELLDRLARRKKLEEIFGTPVVGSIMTFALFSESAKVNLKITTDAIMEERLGCLFDLNAHYEGPPDLGGLEERQDYWMGRLLDWAERLRHDDN